MTTTRKLPSEIEREIRDRVLKPDSQKLLKAVFGENWLDAWVCWKSNMTGKRVRWLEQYDLPAGDDCYFCIAMLMSPQTRRRALGNVLAVHAVVIDDVGTKIDKDGFDMLAPEPTWMIETSKGNWQAGYALNPPLTVEQYKKLRDDMARHPVWGKSDGIDAVHLFRLPQGTNTKTGWAVS